MGRCIAALFAAGAAFAQTQPRSKLEIHTIGSAQIVDSRIRLTPAVRWSVGAAWITEKQQLSAGFEATFQFELTGQGGAGHGADGFAFVLQNQGTDAIAGRGSAGGFALGDGYGDPSKPGIPRSIAVFFDTFRNPEAGDPSNNYVALCTNGPIANMHWPPRRLGVGRKLRVHLKDGRPHTARIMYKPPLMSVSIDQGEPEFRVPVDISTVVDPSGSAYAGFTASTGDGYENHDILDWGFTPARTSVSSDIALVESEVHFLPDNCLPDRNLCTPAGAVIEEKEPGLYSIILPAHLAWAASIPNPLGKAVSVNFAKGLVCFDLTGTGVDECSGPDGAAAASIDAKARAGFLSHDHNPGALIAETKDGRTRFSINIRKGKPSKDNQGFFDFEVRLR